MAHQVSRRSLLLDGAVTLVFSSRLSLDDLAAGSVAVAPRKPFRESDARAPAVPGFGAPGLELTLLAMTAHTLRIQLAAIDENIDDFYSDGSVPPHARPVPLTTALHDSDASPHTTSWGEYTINISTKPLRIAVTHSTRGKLQELTLDSDHNLVTFLYGDAPVYGLGGGVHPLDRRGTKEMMHSGSGENLRLYGARTPIPWLVGAAGWGLYFHIPTGTFDLSDPKLGVFHPSDVARPLDIFLAVADTPAELMREYAEITGYPHLPAKWTLGFQQSHRTLDSREQIINEAHLLRDRKLPCDTLIYLGTGFCPSGWNTGHGSFTFNQKVFPDPQAIVDEFHRLDFKVVLHVVNPPEYLYGEVADTGAAKQPGNAADYWSRHVPFVKMGIDGWWPDEGDVLPIASRLARNRMYWEGGRLTDPSKRPFALHRNCYAGIQRFGWLWSGDTTSSWATLVQQVAQGINVGLSGIPFWGTDIGGFVTSEELTAELYLRWFQWAAFCPSFRAHGRTWLLRAPYGWNMGTYGAGEMGSNAAAILPRPEDLHNPEVERICRKFLNLRYELLPYTYSAVAETHRTGIPIIRALWLHFPEDPVARLASDVYLWGPSLLVAPVIEKGATHRTLYLPHGSWHSFWDNRQQEGGREITVPVTLDDLPLYVRAGAILPSGPVIQHTMERTSEPPTLTVYPGADGSFNFYDDDGISFHHESGDFCLIALNWTDSARTLTLKPSGGRKTQPRTFSVQLAGSSSRKQVRVSTRTVEVQL